MKKNTTAKKTQRASGNADRKRVRHMAGAQRLTIGLDPGDLHSRYCILGEAAEIVSEGKLPTSKAGLDSLFKKMASSRAALEVGTQPVTCSGTLFVAQSYHRID